MSKENGGPAFPNTPENATRLNGLGGSGMSLRDWFAGQAMAAILTHEAIIERGVEATPHVAIAAYEVADAMLKERSK